MLKQEIVNILGEVENDPTCDFLVAIINSQYMESTRT